jgi:hypothetical protein
MYGHSNNAAEDDVFLTLNLPNTMMLQRRRTYLFLGFGLRSTRMGRKMCTNDVRILKLMLKKDYHLFRENELDGLVDDAAHACAQDMHSNDLCIVKEAGGWEKGNWWGIWRVVSAVP